MGRRRAPLVVQAEGAALPTLAESFERVVHLAGQTAGPLVEWGAGEGALTFPLSRLGRPLESVEIDTLRVRRLRRRAGPHVCISEGDILRHAPPVGSTVVSNVPFALTTPVLRHLLRRPGWVRAVLLLQWEVARKRAAVGGATQLTAQWWPWLTFTLDRRVPAAAFRPRPVVDAGLLVIDRREMPLLPEAQRARYQAWVAQVFAGRGRAVVDIVARSGRMTQADAGELGRRLSVDPRALPRDLTAEQWVALFTGPDDFGPRRRSARHDQQRRAAGPRPDRGLGRRRAQR